MSRMVLFSLLLAASSMSERSAAIKDRLSGQWCLTKVCGGIAGICQDSSQDSVSMVVSNGNASPAGDTLLFRYYRKGSLVHEKRRSLTGAQLSTPDELTLNVRFVVDTVTLDTSLFLSESGVFDGMDWHYGRTLPGTRREESMALSKKGGLTLQPNPACGFVSSNEVVTKYTLQIYALDGREVHQVSGHGSVCVDLKALHLAPGGYVFRTLTPAGGYSHRIVIR